MLSDPAKSGGANKAPMHPPTMMELERMFISLIASMTSLLSGMLLVRIRAPYVNDTLLRA